MEFSEVHPIRREVLKETVIAVAVVVPFMFFTAYLDDLSLPMAVFVAAVGATLLVAFGVFSAHVRVKQDEIAREMYRRLDKLDTRMDPDRKRENLNKHQHIFGRRE